MGVVGKMGITAAECSASAIRNLQEDGSFVNEFGWPPCGVPEFGLTMVAEKPTEARLLEYERTEFIS